MMDLSPLTQAAVATVLAVARLASLAAVGGIVLRESLGAITVPARILIGAAGVGALNAALLRGASADAALLADVGLALGGLAIGWRSLLVESAALFRPAVAALRRDRRLLAAALLLLAVYWINAAAPPRDTDSLRYHLALIANIDREGRWMSLPIPHYAFPFAWQSTFLPFIRLRVPEAAQLTSLGLLILGSAVVHANARLTAAGSATRRIALLTLPLSTGVVTSFTDAGADAYTMFAAVVVCALLVDVRRDQGMLMLTGFAAAVALGSRYQGAAIALASTVAVIVRSRRADAVRHELPPFLLGALAALVVASPYYLANLETFGNPVWPLLGGRAYDDAARRVGAAFAETWRGSYDPRWYARSVAGVLVDRSVFPVPVLLVAALAIAWRTTGAQRVLGSWLATYLAVWSLAQPMLFPRFAMYAFPAALLILVAPNVAPRESAPRTRRVQRALLAAATVVVVAQAAYTIAFTRFPAQYLVTGDLHRYHRFTWYHPVYAWMNARSATSARVLVLVASGETFHLDRLYRRADPWNSGIVDWPAVTDADALDRVLACGRFDHVILEDRDWGPLHGGTRIGSIAREAARRGLLREAAVFELQLTRSRFRGTPAPVTVRVYERGARGARRTTIQCG